MIRKAKSDDLNRIAEIEVFNYRLKFYPIFLDDEFYFGELQVTNVAKRYADSLEDIAKMANSTPNSVTVRLYRLRKKLKYSLMKEGLLV